MKEIWKEVPNFNGVYLINNHGKVKSIDRYVKYRDSERLIRGQPMKSFIDSSGYWHIVLWPSCNDEPGVHFKIHRLLGLLFIPNPNNLPQLNHINGIKTDNRLKNLEWCTMRHNVRHAYKLGLAKGKSGSSNPASKFTEEIVKEIMRLRATTTTVELCSMFNVSRWMIESIYRGDTWSHLTGIKKRMRDENRIILENRNTGIYTNRRIMANRRKSGSF